MAFLNISKTQNKNIVKTIDRENYMRLGKPTSRLDLFDFAVALGVHGGGVDTQTPLQNKESFVRDEYIGNERYLFSALCFEELEVWKNHNLIDQVIDDNVSFQIAEKYAEEGFKILEDYMKQMGEMPFCYKLIAEMDSIYMRIKDELPKEHIGIEFEGNSTSNAADESEI